MTSNSLKKPEKSLPFHWYYDPKIFQKEIDKIFNNEWIYVCHVNSIEKNHYRTLNINNKNIVLIKSKSENISIFYNTCLHRGSQIFEEQEGRMKSPVIVCPYHQWSYDVSSGSLLNTTSMKLNNFDKKNYSLQKVNFHIWKGLVFVNLKSKKKFNVQSIFQYYDRTIEKIDIEKSNSFSIGIILLRIILLLNENQIKGINLID